MPLMDTPPATPGNGQLRASYAAPPVELFDAIRICLKEKYASFSGRASRSEFWFFQLFLFLLTVVAQIILTIFFFLHFASAAASARDANDAAFATVDSMFEGAGFFILFGIAALFMLALALPTMAVATRRLHDTGRSGWWLLLPVVPYLGCIALLTLGMPAPDTAPEATRAAVQNTFTFAMLLQMASMLGAIVMIIFCCLPGQEHPNRFDH